VVHKPEGFVNTMVFGLGSLVFDVQFEFSKTQRKDPKAKDQKPKTKGQPLLPNNPSSPLKCLGHSTPVSRGIQ
jgi:hypothetical protein